MSKGGFVERWSRRKLAAGNAEPGPGRDQAPDVSQVPEAPPLADPAVEETLNEAELAQLPSLESFTIKTDLTPFLRKGVPHALRNAAMRKMWMLDPAIRDHKDLAVDYAWDWNTPGGVPGNSGTISRQSVERMLESLNPKPKEPATAQSDPVDDTPDARESTAAAAPEAQAQTHSPVSMPQETPGKGVSDEPDATRADDLMPRPRRHGGAAPV